jgi:hypothetical protein
MLNKEIMPINNIPLLIIYHSPYLGLIIKDDFILFIEIHDMSNPPERQNFHKKQMQETM